MPQSGVIEKTFEIKPGELVVTGFATIGVGECYVRLGKAKELIKTQIKYTKDENGHVDPIYLKINDYYEIDFIKPYRGENALSNFRQLPIEHVGIFDLFFSNDAKGRLSLSWGSVNAVHDVIGIDYQDGINFEEPTHLILYSPLKL
jgi:hypothetical protein